MTTMQTARLVPSRGRRSRLRGPSVPWGNGHADPVRRFRAAERGWLELAEGLPATGPARAAFRRRRRRLIALSRRAWQTALRGGTEASIAAFLSVRGGVR
jgi:hypothetical protein